MSPDTDRRTFHKLGQTDQKQRHPFARPLAAILLTPTTHGELALLGLPAEKESFVSSQVFEARNDQFRFELDQIDLVREPLGEQQANKPNASSWILLTNLLLDQSNPSES